MLFIPVAENADLRALLDQYRLDAVPKEAKRTALYMQLLLLDIVALILGPVLIHLIDMDRQPLTATLYPMLAIICAYLFSALSNESYSAGALARGLDSIRFAASSLLPAMLLVAVVAFLVGGSFGILHLRFAASVVLGACLLFAGRGAFCHYARRSVGGQLMNRLVIVDGRPTAGWEATDVVLDAAHHSLAPNLDDPVVLDRFGRLAQAFDRIVIDCVPERNQDWAILLKGANVDGEIILTGFEDLGGLGVGAAADGRSTIVVSRRPLSVRARVLKRAFDLSLTVPVLVALSPLLLLTALLVKLDTPGPILFKQDRIGRGNRLFKVLKFRSMRDEASDMTGKRSTSRNDDRITRVGRFIRATSIDELPQLFNVLLGDMSLVGPRPHTIGSLAEGQLFWHIDIRYWHRHQLKPGITGLAQVRGFRGATHQMSDLTNRLQADMEYIQQWSIWRDLQILLNTFRVIVHHNAF